mmetsp:Transcript_4111/g.15492  ORF Transcript_4111/g.15492 Transcript_4111/m.15492 type:complete len:89 (+) Transcript_4111:1238-1504(+)
MTKRNLKNCIPWMVNHHLWLHHHSDTNNSKWKPKKISQGRGKGWEMDERMEASLGRLVVFFLNLIHLNTFINQLARCLQSYIPILREG